MGWFSKYLSKYSSRSIDDTPSTDEPQPEQKPMLQFEMLDPDGNPYISAVGSLNLSAVWACVRIISDAISALPLHLYKKTAEGREVIHNRVSDLLDEPNEYNTRIELINALMTNVLLWGNGYIRIYRDHLHNPIELELLHPSSCRPGLSTERILFYYLSNGDVLNSTDVIHIKGLSTNGVVGKSPISAHRENLQIASAAQKYAKAFYINGGNMSGVFTIPHSMKDAEYDRLSKQLRQRAAGLHNAQSPLVLEGGMQYTRISIPPEDAQMLGTRKFEKTEIATIFGVPPHKIADLEKSTNNNIEHQGMEFVTDCLQPYIVKIEQQFKKKLLATKDQGTMYFKFGMGALLRGDSTARSTYYAKMINCGVLTPNKVCDLEDINQYEDGNEHYIPLNMQTVKNSKKSNTNV